MDLVAHLWAVGDGGIHSWSTHIPRVMHRYRTDGSADDGGHLLSTLRLKAERVHRLNAEPDWETAVAHAESVDLDGVFAWVDPTERSIMFQRYNPDTLSRELHDLPDGTPAIRMFRLDGTLAEVKHFTNGVRVAPEPPAHPEFFGAASVAWYDQFVAANPTLAHITSVAAAESILRHGFDPARGATQSDPSAPPAAGRVYFGRSDRSSTDWLATLAGFAGAAHAVVEVNTAMLDRGRLAPDEDAFEVAGMGGIVDSDEFGVPPMLTGEDTGTWAVRVRLGEQPGIVEAAWAEKETIAHVGAVPASAIRRVEFFDHDGQFSHHVELAS